MPVTRSSTRSSVPTVNAASGVFSVQDDQLVQNAEKLGASPRKRKAMASSAIKSKKSEPEVQTYALGSSPIPSHQDASEPETLVPAMLSFNFEEAKRHLIDVDHRFEDLFSKMQCKPFQHLEQVHPFRYEGLKKRYLIYLIADNYDAGS
jgi:DNA-3-methyladenine glycosylase II